MVLLRGFTQVATVFIIDVFGKKRKRLPKVQRDGKSEVFLSKLIELAYRAYILFILLAY
jgi:hypothetical protein